MNINTLVELLEMRTRKFNNKWERMEALRVFSKKIIRKISLIELERKRKHFDNAFKNSRKGYNHYRKRVRSCWVCNTLNCALITHHIISLNHGGTSERENLVILCNPCHKLIHEWIACNFRNPTQDIKLRGKHYDMINVNRAKIALPKIKSMLAESAQMDTAFKNTTL